jgi:hypothetical protein
LLGSLSQDFNRGVHRSIESVFPEEELRETRRRSCDRNSRCLQDEKEKRESLYRTSSPVPPEPLDPRTREAAKPRPTARFLPRTRTHKTLVARSVFPAPSLTDLRRPGHLMTRKGHQKSTMSSGYRHTKVALRATAGRFSGVKERPDASELPMLLPKPLLLGKARPRRHERWPHDGRESVRTKTTAAKETRKCLPREEKTPGIP